MTILLRSADRSYLVEPGDRLETDLGVIEVPDDVSPGDRVESHLGDPFLVLRVRPTDLFRELERTGAPMIPRDIGLLIGMAGLRAGDEVIDVGTGTGILAITLGLLGMDVRTYERDPEVATIARRNVDRAGVDERVKVVDRDATEVDLEGPVDAVTLDTEDAEALVERVPELLRPGGMLVAYTPFVEAARSIATAVDDAIGLDDRETVEPVHRLMDFDRRGSRPSTAPVGHTGYLTIARHVPPLA